MGMFDKDKEIGIILQNWIPKETPFILWDARIIREDFPTTLGNAVQVGMTVSRMDDPSERYEVTTLASAIAGKVREAEAGDFPAVVQTAYVDSKYGREALVLSFLKPYGKGNVPPVPRDYGPKDPPPAPVEADEIPF